MASAPRAVVGGLTLFVFLVTLPLFAARRKDPGNSQNGAITAVPNCPNANNTPNFAVLDGSAEQHCSVPLGNRIFTLTDPANTFTVTITPALWLSGFDHPSQTNTIFNVRYQNLSSTKTLVLKSLVVGAALPGAAYVICEASLTAGGTDGFGAVFELHDYQGAPFCTPAPLKVPGGREIVEPSAIPGADFTNTRWDFHQLTTAPGDTSSTLSLTFDCIPQEFTPVYDNLPCVNNLVLPGGSGTATQFQAVASDGTNLYTAGTLQIKGTSPATNDTVDTATAITTTPFNDFIDTSLTRPGEILSGSGAGNENNPQGDPSPSCATFPNRVFRSVWYTFTPADDRIVNISTAGSRHDTVLTVFSAKRVNGQLVLTEVGCNDDANSIGNSSDLSFTPVVNTQYYIMVSEAPPDVGTENQNGIQVPTAQPLANRATLKFGLNRGNSVPFIDSIAPVAVAPGDLAIVPEIIISGAGFASGATVNFDGSPSGVTPTSVSPSQIILNNVELSGYSFTLPTTVSITVSPNANPLEGRSNVAYLPVTNPTASVSMFDTDYSDTSGGGFPLLADLNNDGILDLVIPDLGHSALVYLGYGDGSFQPGVAFSTGGGPVAAVVGDFNGDGNLDLATANERDNTASILLGNGDGTFQSPLSTATGSIPDGVAAGDFNQDGNLDLAIVNSGAATVSIFLGDGAGDLEFLKNYSTGFTPTWVLAGDFNGDGKLDLVTANDGSNTLSVLLGNGDGTFKPAVPYKTASAPVLAVAGDFNGDGKLDLASANEGSGNVSVLLGNGDGTFKGHVDYPVGGLTQSVVTGDFNGDGKLDLAAVPFNSLSVFTLLGNGDGTFQAAVPQASGRSLGGLAIGDLNSDGMLDLVTPNTTGYSVLLQQSQAKKNRPGGSSQVTGSPSWQRRGNAH